ncbi:septum formation protein Maf [Candidatus Peregrinibacteria bacterium RIFOXYB12_FULL_41_12]|nr:MAG: septum formation protein Maf [Candidatus Peregrinibacteria bacterium RIFOXYA2_FULL_41_18]OGJ48959.1 MAG: septum formation protein Maf [Candidatus Peregrinibacteria bacterium RIFOXYB12_FULL_41_12]OGJ52623.1 MAG: septum formation protein Maf [Candidatus Peregrinibacteria bacterium RIFOXYC2_FULL_41_22]OGJ53614.1 MAG: septum formation protein Maf [Candidatus Peregrinibacteria bacterium RIFOXYB2_FULL_41_88]
MKKKLILASQSPRRKSLITELGLKFKTDPARNFQEKFETKNSSPAQIVVHNAEGKALEIAQKHKNAYILGVDTIGSYKGEILSKPKNTKDAKRILRFINNTTHEVISGICIISTDKKGKIVKKISDFERTYVTFDRMTEKEIDAYINSGESMDKAAAFAIQGLGSLFIKKIDGDYFNVVGLPIFKMKKMFEELGEKLV